MDAVVSGKNEILRTKRHFGAKGRSAFLGQNSNNSQGRFQFLSLKITPLSPYIRKKPDEIADGVALEWGAVLGEIDSRAFRSHFRIFPFSERIAILLIPALGGASPYNRKIPR